MEGRQLTPFKTMNSFKPLRENWMEDYEDGDVDERCVGCGASIDDYFEEGDHFVCPICGFNVGPDDTAPAAPEESLEADSEWNDDWDDFEWDLEGLDESVSGQHPSFKYIDELLQGVQGNFHSDESILGELASFAKDEKLPMDIRAHALRISDKIMGIDDLFFEDDEQLVNDHMQFLRDEGLLEESAAQQMHDVEKTEEQLHVDIDMDGEKGESAEHRRKVLGESWYNNNEDSQMLRALLKGAGPDEIQNIRSKYDLDEWETRILQSELTADPGEYRDPLIAGLRESVLKESGVTAKFTGPSKGNWVYGSTSNGYVFEAKVFDEPSYYGIDEGRISKLEIKKEDASWKVTVLVFDRGSWGFRDQDTGEDLDPRPYLNEEVKAALDAIVDLCENS